MKKPNDIILKTVTNVAVVIILTFAINLFISGHHNPGGGLLEDYHLLQPLFFYSLSMELKW